jgi:hypothetical protein
MNESVFSPEATPAEIRTELTELSLVEGEVSVSIEGYEAVPEHEPIPEIQIELNESTGTPLSRPGAAPETTPNLIDFIEATNGLPLEPVAIPTFTPPQASPQVAMPRIIRPEAHNPAEAIEWELTA